MGYAIDVYQDTINKTFREYLVNYKYLTLMMERYGFRLLNADELDSVGFSKSIGSFGFQISFALIFPKTFSSNDKLT